MYVLFESGILWCGTFKQDYCLLMAPESPQCSGFLYQKPMIRAITFPGSNDGKGFFRASLHHMENQISGKPLLPIVRNLSQKFLIRERVAENFLGLVNSAQFFQAFGTL